jgi:transcription-repair coupling factor (superfamily II helicase)
MNAIDELVRSLKARPRATILCGAPEGYDAAVVGRLVGAEAGQHWLHVCRDDGRMARFAAALAFFHPEIEVLVFPAWDCLPYDRDGYHSEAVSRVLGKPGGLRRRFREPRKAPRECGWETSVLTG